MRQAIRHQTLPKRASAHAPRGIQAPMPAVRQAFRKRIQSKQASINALGHASVLL